MTTHRHTYTVRFSGYPVPSGRTIDTNRTSENIYTHACYIPGKGVSFHKSQDAAYKKAGKRGAVLPVTEVTR